MKTLAVLTVLLLTLGHASIAAAEEPDPVAPPQSSEREREVLAQLDRLQTKLSNELSREVGDQLDARSAAALTKALDRRSRRLAAR